MRVFTGKTSGHLSLLNAAARLIYWTSRCQHVTSLLQQPDWLPSTERVYFKLAVLIFSCLHGLAPGYLSEDIHHVVDTDHRCLHSSLSSLLTNTAACDNGRSCLSGCWQQTLQQFTAPRHLCSHTFCSHLKILHQLWFPHQLDCSCSIVVWQFYETLGHFK